MHVDIKMNMKKIHGLLCMITKKQPNEQQTYSWGQLLGKPSSHAKLAPMHRQNRRISTRKMQARMQAHQMDI